MKIDFMKLHGGVLTPFTDMDSDKMTRFKTGEVYPVEIKTCRHPEFHKKVICFFIYCFKYWADDNGYITQQASFDWFRKKLIIKAGYYHERYDLQGRLELEARSMAYGNMEQDEFERLYKAVVQAALNTIFKDCDESEYNKLMSFF